MTPEKRYYTWFFLKLDLILVALLALLWWLNNVVYAG
jgi:hypothetical protein